MTTLKNIKDVDFVQQISAIVTIPHVARVIFIIVNVIILTSSTCTNLYAIVIILCSRNVKKCTLGFLLTLTISDLTLVLSSIPVDLALLTSKYHSWPLGSILCKAVPFFQTMSIMLNAFCLFGISLERYILVKRLLPKSKLRENWKRFIPYVGLGLMWIISIGISLPQLWTFELLSYNVIEDITIPTMHNQFVLNETYYMCYQAPSKGNFLRVFFYCMTAVIFIILLIGFIFCYLSIIKFIEDHRKNCSALKEYKWQNTNGNNGGSSVPITTTSTENDTIGDNEFIQNPNNQRFNHHDHQSRTIRLIMTLIIIFCVCRLPLWSYLIYLNVKIVSPSELILSLVYIFHIISNLYTVISPLLYAVWNDSLRPRNNSNDQNLSKNRICPSQICCNYKLWNVRTKHENRTIPGSPVFLIELSKTNQI